MKFVVVNKAKRYGGGKVRTYRRVHALGQKMEGAIKADFIKGVERFKLRVHPEAMLKAFMNGKYDEVVTTVPWKTMGKDLEPMLGSMGRTIKLSADGALKELPFADKFRYSVANPKIAAYLKGRTGELITTSEAGMLEAVRAATQRALTHGLTPVQVGRELRDSIGLNAPQARALANYRSGLATGLNAKEPDEIDTLAEAYRQRMLDYRATMIGRTEVRFAANEGQQDVWEAAVDEGLMPDGTQRVWVVDGNPCPEICLPMNGVAVGLDEPWILPDDREVDNPTQSHPHCYCISTLRFPGQR